jgi:hypothetical protein
VAVFAVTPTIGAAETAAPHFDLSTPLANVNVLLLQTASTDAAQVIQSSDVLGYVSPSPSSAPVQPPAILSEQIKNGEHVLILEGSGAGGSSNGAPPSTTTGEHAPSPAPEPPSAPSATTGAPPELPANSPIVTAAITQFASEVSALDVSYSGREVILYDAALLHPVGPGTQLDSVTFNFADGSSISLVGTAAELQGLHLPFPVG